MKAVMFVVMTWAGVANAQSTWFVDASAAAPGSGTATSPFASIQYAHDQSSTQHLDTILVAPGVYDEHLVITKRVTIRSTQGPLQTALRPSSTGATVNLIGTLDQFHLTVLEGFAVYPADNLFGVTTRARSGTMRRCIVVGDGFGIGALTDFDFAIEHCLITGHEVGMTSSNINLIYGRNNIVVGNVVEDVELGNGDLTSYSCYGSGQFFNTVGTITSDPMLFDPLGHDFHLLAGSPCIDAGDPNSPLDPDGTRADMGPLPFDAAYAPFSVYCTAKTNSLGCVPTIGASGTASFTSPAPFHITCTNELNNKLGLLFYGSTPHAAAYQGGWLCVATPVRRTSVVSSGGNVNVDDCSGTYSFEFNTLIQGGVDPELAPGRLVYAQYWSRDPGASFTTNRSDALRIEIAP